MTYETIADLYDAVECEGGLVPAIINYGIRASALPEGTPPSIVYIWEELEGMDSAIREVQLWLEDNADEGRSYD